METKASKLLIASGSNEDGRGRLDLTSDGRAMESAGLQMLCRVEEKDDKRQTAVVDKSKVVPNYRLPRE